MDRLVHVPRPRSEAAVGGGRGVPARVMVELRKIRDDVTGLLVQHVEAMLIDGSAPDPRRSRLIRSAVGLAVVHFIDLAAGQRPERRELAEAYRQLGHMEAAHRDDLGRMHATWQIGTRHAWREISGACGRAKADSVVLAALGDLLFAFLDDLFLHVQDGFETAKRPDDHRGRLGRALTLPQHADELRGLAEQAGWDAPSDAVVVVVDHQDGGRAPDLSQLGPGPLVWSDAWRTSVIFDAAHDERVRRPLLALTHPAPTAIVGPVPLRTVADAYRWARQALELRRQRRLPPDRVVDCRVNLPTLVLSVDPSLRDHLVKTTLFPLLALGPHERWSLGETLRHWLLNESAPDVAAALGRHPNTVRHRIRRLRELFGERLVAPADRVQLLMALTAALPDWRIDYERNRRPDRN